MNDVEIVIFNDKAWVRFSDYEKVKEENEQLKQKIEKMKCCLNCKYYEGGTRAHNDCVNCSIMFCQCQLDKHWCESHDICKFWELKELEEWELEE